MLIGKRLLWALLLGALLNWVEGDTGYIHYRKPNRVMSACSQVVPAMGTFCDSAANKFSCYCKNPYAVATAVGCIDLIYGLDDKMKQIYSDQCLNYYLVYIAPEQFDIALDLYRGSAKNVSELSNFNINEPVDYPILVNETLARMYEEAYDTFLGKGWERSLYYGAALLGYWLIVIACASVINWSQYLYPEFFTTHGNSFSYFVKKHITIPAVHKSNHASKKVAPMLTMLVPTRIESLILAGFSILTVALLAVHIRIIDDSEFTSKMTHLVLRMLGIRSSFLASYLTPLLILFSGRSNFLQWITRWNYSTFNAFHRWISRIVVLLIVIHSVCYSLYYRALGTYLTKMKENYMIWGLVGTAVGTILFGHGIHYLRSKWYEVFLMTHIILAAIFIAASWIHVRTLGFVFWFYAAAAAWVFDRIVRMSLLISFGCPYANVTLVADETLRVVVARPYHWQYSPGAHAFVHFLRPSCFWQSHPFTITSSFDNGKNLVFHCKVKGGVTHGLYQHLMTCRNQSARIRVSVEGPYGETGEAKKYQSTIFIAGGNGIPGMYSEAMDIAIKRLSRGKSYTKLIWIVREYKSLFWFYPELMSMKNTGIHPIIYITNPGSISSMDDFDRRLTNGTKNKWIELSESSIVKNFRDDKAYARIISLIRNELSHVTFEEGRPDISSVVKYEIAASQGSTAIIACGHPQMVDEIRYAISKNLKPSNAGRIEFIDRLQTWT